MSENAEKPEGRGGKPPRREVLIGRLQQIEKKRKAARAKRAGEKKRRVKKGKR